MMCLSLGPTRCRPCDENYAGGIPENTGREAGKRDKGRKGEGW